MKITVNLQIYIVDGIHYIEIIIDDTRIHGICLFYGISEYICKNLFSFFFVKTKEPQNLEHDKKVVDVCVYCMYYLCTLYISAPNMMKVQKVRTKKKTKNKICSALTIM